MFVWFPKMHQSIEDVSRCLQELLGFLGLIMIYNIQL
jgi:hypothetical protein